MEETDRQITACCRLIRGASQREGEKKREDGLGMVYKAERRSGGILLYARF